MMGVGKRRVGGVLGGRWGRLGAGAETVETRLHGAIACRMASCPGPRGRRGGPTELRLDWSMDLPIRGRIIRVAFVFLM